MERERERERIILVRNDLKQWSEKQNGCQKKNMKRGGGGGETEEKKEN